MAQRALAAAGTALIAVWAISVAGATGWGASVNWTLLGVGAVLLGLRAARFPRG